MKKIKIKNVVMATAFGLLAFVILIAVSHVFGNNTNYVDMVLTKKDIPKGQSITESNINEFFEDVPTDDKLKTDDVIMDKNSLIGFYANRDIKKSELVHRSSFEDETDEKSKYEEPTEVSFAVSDFSAAVNGTIRKGDRINIYELLSNLGSSSSQSATLSEGDGTETLSMISSEPLVENAYVIDAFDSSGVKIEPGDNKTVATNFTIYVEKSFENSFCNAVKDKAVAATKVSE